MSDYFMKKNLRHNILEVSSILIATFALILTIWQGCEMKTNYRLSVTPKLMFSYMNYNIEKGFDISMRNSGIGPAIIDDITLEVDSNIYHASTLEGRFWTTVLKAYNIHDSIISKNFSYYMFNKGTFISQDEVWNILEFRVNDLSIDVYVKIMDLLSRFTLISYYHSIYNERYSDSLYFNKSKYYLSRPNFKSKP